VSRDATQVSGRHPDGFERLTIDQAILTITVESFLRISRK